MIDNLIIDVNSWIIILILINIVRGIMISLYIFWWLRDIEKEEERGKVN